MDEIHGPIEDPEWDALMGRVTALLDGVTGPAGDALRDVVEWAAGVETLRQMGDESAPTRPVGREVVAIVVERLDG